MHNIDDKTKVANDEWILAIPEGRNERCPCGCGKKWKKVEQDPEPQFEQFKANLEKIENENIN